jgi:cysteine desulfurase/selenocysteine lyase
LTVVDELIEDFADLDEREACEYLDELGRELPQIPASVYADDNLVPGCQSRVWLVNQLSDSQPKRLKIYADSDAIVVKGLVYIVLEMYSGLTPQEVLDVDYVKTFDRLGLGRLILPQRKNGLYSMVKTIRAFAARELGVTPPTPRSSALPKSHSVPSPTRQIPGIAREFPILARPLPNGERPVFLDSAASSQKPSCVIEKEREVEEQYYANAFRGRYYFGQRVDDEIESARAKVAQLIGAERSDEIVFTPGTTMSINTVAAGWGRKFIQPGDEVVITEMEHHANFVPWQTVARERGAILKILPITDDGLLDIEAIDSLITEKTAIVAVCSMSNVLGTVNPLDQISRRARACGARLFIDAAQSVPHQRLNLQDVDIDFLAFSGHKLYGPSGVGVLYGKYDLLESMDPFLYGGHMIQTVGREVTTWAEPPAKFEAGTPPIVQIIGLGAAIDFVNSIGFDAIQRLEHKLLSLAHERLNAIPGLTIYGPNLDQKGAIVSFSVEGISTEDLARRLDDRGIFTRHGHHCAMVLHERLGVPATTRASFGLYNTEEDVADFVRAIEFAVEELSPARQKSSRQTAKSVPPS